MIVVEDLTVGNGCGLFDGFGFGFGGFEMVFEC
jgi:hypothetical protein